VNISTIFFDLDDTLYPSSSGLWLKIKERIGIYMQERLNIPAGEMHALRRKYFEQYGTTLRGLQANYNIDVPEFLAYVHDLPLREYIQPDPALHAVLRDLPVKKLIFTNADIHHARRVLQVLELEQFFEGIVDVVALEPFCKPMSESFGIALAAAGETDPSRCVMIDDLPRTTRAAREMGLFSILFGQQAFSPDANATLLEWSGLPELLNMSRSENAF
jgi:putative hydrolase of the HAD superfamily